MKQKEYYISPRISVTRGYVSENKQYPIVGDDWTIDNCIDYDIDYACHVAESVIEHGLCEVNEEGEDYGNLRTITITAEYRRPNSSRTWHEILFKSEYRLSGKNGWKFVFNLDDLKKVPSEFDKLRSKVTIDDITDIKQLCDIANLMNMNMYNDYVERFIEDVVRIKNWYKIPTDRQLCLLIPNFRLCDHSVKAGNGTQFLYFDETDSEYKWASCSCKK